MISRCAFSETSAFRNTLFDWRQWHRLERRFTALSIRPQVARARCARSQEINVTFYSRREFTLARHHKYQVELRKSHMCIHIRFTRIFHLSLELKTFPFVDRNNRTKTGKKSALDHYICESNSVLQPNKPLRHKSRSTNKKGIFRQMDRTKLFNVN